MTIDMRKWERVPCGCCNGCGMESDYGLGGDFYGPKECGGCNGSGVYFRHRRTGTLAAWPGGPLMGREPKMVKQET